MQRIKASGHHIARMTSYITSTSTKQYSTSNGIAKEADK